MNLEILSFIIGWRKIMSRDWVKDIFTMHSHYKVHPVVDNMDKEKLKKFLEFRANFLQEELDELKKADNADDVVDALIDLCVVAIGTLDAFNIDAYKAWNAVYDANMKKEVGIKDSGLNKLIRVGYDLLGLQTYFTAGPKEIRAWTIKKGTKAPQAAGVIHSDFERGFIRAEVMKYQDLIKLGSEQKVKEVGRYIQKGRDYVVEDGDIINFLFNV